MKKQSIYYDHIINKLDVILYNKGFSPYQLGYCVIKNSDDSYCIQDLNSSTAKESYDNQENIKSFLRDFKSYLESDRPFEIKYNNADYLYHNLLDRLSDHLFEVRNNNYSSQNNIIRPSVNELEKVLKCFEQVIPSITNLIKNLPNNYSPGDEFHKYIPAILSINNQNMFIHKDDKYLKKMISDEIDALSGNFSSENDTIIVQGIKNYLDNKRPFFAKLNNVNFESGLFDTVQYIIDSKYWAEVADYLPNLKLSKKKKSIDEDLFKMDFNPIFHFNLDKEEILNISPSIITDRDFDKMIVLVSEVINNNKPKSIDFIQTCVVQDKVKVIMLGESMSQDLSFQIGKLFEKMIHEYNSENVIKQSHYHEDTTVERKNNEYLSKAAEVHWLNLEMDNSSLNNTKKKVNKL